MAPKEEPKAKIAVPEAKETPETQQNAPESLKQEGLEARLKMKVETEVDRLQKEIAAKPEGDTLHYKTFAFIKNIPEFPGYKWFDAQTNQEIKADKLTNFLMQKDSLKADESDINLKKFFEAVSKQKDEDKKRALEEMQDDSKTSILDIQSGMQFEKMTGAFLSADPQKGTTFNVDLKNNPKFEMYVGLGHILPPSVQKVKVTDAKGNVRVGNRDIRNKVGYFDNQGYIQIFSGYKVEILETISEDSDVYKQTLEKEKAFYKDQKEVAQNGAWKVETIDQMVKEGKDDNKEYVEDWHNVEKILLEKRIKIDSMTLITDAQILRSYKGKTADKFGGWDKEKNAIKDPENQTLKLLEKFAKGGQFGSYTILQGYEFKLGDLEKIEKYAGDERLMLADFKKVFDKKGGVPMSFEDVIKALNVGEDAMTLDEVRGLPQFRRRIAENGLPFKTPEDYLNGMRGCRAIKIDPRTKNPDVYRDGHILGNLMCARYVSDVLGVQPPDYSASSLFTRLVKGGGKIIPDLKSLKRGDIIFLRGTYGNKWNAISHVGYIVDSGNGYITMRHNGGPKQGIQTKRIQLNDAYAQKFYAGVRQA